MLQFKGLGRQPGVNRVLGSATDGHNHIPTVAVFGSVLQNDFKPCHAYADNLLSFWEFLQLREGCRPVWKPSSSVSHTLLSCQNGSWSVTLGTCCGIMHLCRVWALHRITACVQSFVHSSGQFWPFAVWVFFGRGLYARSLSHRWTDRYQEENREGVGVMSGGLKYYFYFVPQSGMGLDPLQHGVKAVHVIGNGKHLRQDFSLWMYDKAVMLVFRNINTNRDYYSKTSSGYIVMLYSQCTVFFVALFYIKRLAVFNWSIKV